MSEKRRYSVALRSEQTSLTRRRILAAAGQLFLERGYLGTTLTEIAASAQVSVQTVYNVLGGKPSLLKAVYDLTLAGDDEPVPMAQRPVFKAMIEAADGRECLARYAEISRMLGERVLGLVVMLSAQAAAGDAELRAFTDTIENERATGTARTAHHVAERFGLREGLDPVNAADVLWALTSPDLADRLVSRRSWGWDRYEQWLGVALGDALLRPAAGR